MMPIRAGNDEAGLNDDGIFDTAGEFLVKRITEYRHQITTSLAYSVALLA